MSIFKCSCRYVVVISFCMLLMSCGGGSDSSSPPASPSASVQTIRWQPDGNGFVQLLTNDAQYYDSNFWSTFNQTNETQMSTVTATVKKQSGSLYGGYGIMFCYQDTDNFYRLLIDADGQYSVYAKVGGVFSAVIPWAIAPSTHLNSGVGAENVISVSQLSPNNFAVIFNGTQEALFTDVNFTGGKAGFSAYVDKQANENFPNTAEDMRFKLSSPLAYP